MILRSSLDESISVLWSMMCCDDVNSKFLLLAGVRVDVCHVQERDVCRARTRWLFAGSIRCPYMFDVWLWLMSVFVLMYDYDWCLYMLVLSDCYDWCTRVYIGTIYRSYSIPILLPNKILVFPFFSQLIVISLWISFFSLYFFKYPDLFKVKMFRVYGLVKQGDFFILFMAFCLCGILLSNFLWV